MKLLFCPKCRFVVSFLKKELDKELKEIVEEATWQYEWKKIDAFMKSIKSKS
jgi:hypothetical protein